MGAAGGDRLGPYELVSRIGAGGMGEVWRARDARLQRDVAVKVLPAEYEHDAALRIRFEREARAISQLHHPHICPLFDVGENYLVMELLEGESLATRLERGALPVPEVLRYGAQIAEAVDCAHGAGIVHRDLKPGNVMVTRSGAKLLDFGLAKGAAGFVRADGATAEKRLTEEGMVVGTFQYMAPEQLQGAAVDARTDIFALGAVLYEMTTGRAAFEGESRMSLAAAILSSEPPPVSQLQPLAPPALEHVIYKCLRKDPEERWQSARDIAEELRWIATPGGAPVPVVKEKRRDWIWIAMLLAVLAGATWAMVRPGAPAESVEAEIIPEGNSGPQYLSGPPALSPDGKWLVYSAAGPDGQRKLWLRSIERGFTRPVAGTENAVAPFWSPDGRFIGFTSLYGTVRKVSLAGGEPETIATGTVWGRSWNRNGVILVSLGYAGIGRVPASGGEVEPILQGDEIGSNFVGWPSFLADGNHYLLMALGGRQAGIWVATLDRSEKPRFLTPSDSLGVFVKPGFLLFSRDGVLRAQRFDPRSLRVSGEATAIAPVHLYEGVALFTASDSGLLVFQPPGTTMLSELVVRDRKGTRVRRVGDPSFYYIPRLSPDGSRIAVDRSDTAGKGDIWILDAEDGAPSRLSYSRHNETSPVWSSRGDELVYTREEGRGDTIESSTLVRQRIGDRAVPVVTSPRFDFIMARDWSPDGRHLAVDHYRGGVHWDVVLWSFAGRQWIDVATDARGACCGAFSPDGKWIAYASDESGRWEIYVQRVPPSGEKYQVSPAGGVLPRWTRAGEIIYIDAKNVLHFVTVQTAPLFRIGPPRPLFAVDSGVGFPQYDVLPDGNILVNSLVHGQAAPMKLITQWHRRLEPRD